MRKLLSHIVVRCDELEMWILLKLLSSAFFIASSLIARYVDIHCKRIYSFLSFVGSRFLLKIGRLVLGTLGRNVEFYLQAFTYFYLYE